MNPKIKTMKNAELLPAQRSTQPRPASRSASSKNDNPYKMSTWTPKSKPANDSMFSDRRELIKKWFGSWSDSQKRAVVKDILDHSQTDVNFQKFVHQQVKSRHPFPEGFDFTTILKKDLSLKIFSYLSPKDLSNASLACSHWRELAEDDRLWYRHCQRNNWQLQKPQSRYERATWKRLYSSMMFQTFQAAQAFQPQGFMQPQMTQDQLMLLNNRFTQQASLRPSSNNGMPMMSPQAPGNNSSFPNNRPPNMVNNPLTNSGMIANSTNYALLQQLNMQMTPRQNQPPDQTNQLYPQQFDQRPGTASTAINSRPGTQRSSRPTSKASLANRPNSRNSSLTRKGRVKNSDLENRPAWKSNDKKPIDTRRKNYDLNESFLNSRPATPKNSKMDHVQGKVSTFRPGSRPGSMRKKRPSGSKENAQTNAAEPKPLTPNPNLPPNPQTQILNVHSPDLNFNQFAMNPNFGMQQTMINSVGPNMGQMYQPYQQNI